MKPLTGRGGASVGSDTRATTLRGSNFVWDYTGNVAGDGGKLHARHSANGLNTVYADGHASAVTASGAPNDLSEATILALYSEDALGSAIDHEQNSWTETGGLLNKSLYQAP